MNDLAELNHVTFETSPPTMWQERCKDSRDLFHSPEWQKLLKRTFGTHSIYMWDSVSDIGAAIPIFSVGPFRSGYVAFPVGGTLGNKVVSSARIQTIKQQEIPRSLHVLNWPMSPFLQPETLPFPSSRTLETAIPNLQDWEIANLKSNARRDIRKSQRTGLKLSEASIASHGSNIYWLYRKTIVRHDGNLRYSEQYFKSLVDFSKEHSGIRCLLAICEGNIAGFTVVALSGEVAYYLHAAIDRDFRQYLPSEFLVHAAIKWAQNEGARVFSLMSSPLDQPTLVRYKEKWGGGTRTHFTYELLNPSAMGRLYKLARRTYDWLEDRNLSNPLHRLLLQS